MTPLTKSAIITVAGFIVGSIMQFLIYPIFGLSVSITTVLSLGLIFTVVAFVSNYISLKVIEYFESKIVLSDANEMKGNT